MPRKPTTIHENPVESTPAIKQKDTNLETERRESAGNEIVGPVPANVPAEHTAGNVCSQITGAETEALENENVLEEDVVDDYNYGVGFNPNCLIGGYSVSGEIQLDLSCRVMEPDIKGNCKTSSRLATAMGFTPKNPLFNWEAATTEACNGYCVQGTKLHPYELAGCMVKCFEEHGLGTPNAQELSYLARLVKDLEESRNLQGDYMRHVSWMFAKYCNSWTFAKISAMGYEKTFPRLEIECANACGQLKFENGDIQSQLADLSKRVTILEKGLDDLKKGAQEHETALSTCKNHIWALQNGGSIMGQSMASNQNTQMACGFNAGQQKSAAPKRRIDMASSSAVATAKRVYTLRAGCRTNTPLATPLFNVPAPPPFKPNTADIVIVLDDPSDPLGGYYPWQVEVHGHVFECILNGIIYAEAIACATPHMSSMAKALNQRFGTNDGTHWTADFHEYKRELTCVWNQVSNHVKALKIDVADKWFKSGDGRDTVSGHLYDSVEDAMDTVAYATLKSTIQNAVDNNAGLRQLLWSSGNARGPNGWVKTNRVIRCASKRPPDGWQGALMCGAIKGKLECAILTEDGPNFLAPYMNLFGLAWMEVCKSITEDSAFTQRTDNGEIKLLADEGLFAEFDNAKQWDAGDVYATVQANLIAPESYMEKQRQNATLRRGYMPQILESVAGQQNSSAQRGASSARNRSGKSVRNDAQQRGNGRGGRGNARGGQRGQFGGRGGTGVPKQRTAYQKTQRVMTAMREPIVESDQVMVSQQPGNYSGNQFNYPNALVAPGQDGGQAEHGQDVAQAGGEQDGADVILMGDNTQDHGGNSGALAAGSSTAGGPRDSTYAGYAQASVAASLRTTSTLHAKLLKQVRMAGAAPKRQNFKQFRLSALDANNHLKCVKSLAHYIESTLPYDDATMLTDAVLGRRAKKMSDVVRMLHNGKDMGPQCEFRDVDHTCAISRPPKFTIENKNPYDYFFLVLLLRDSTCASLTNYFGRDCAKYNVPVIVHSYKALFSGKRLPTISAAASELSLTTTYDVVVIRCGLNSCDAEHCYASGIAIDVIESYFMTGILHCVAEIQNSAGYSLHPSGKIIVSVIGPTLPRHMKNGWGRELLLDSFEFFYKVEGALFDLFTDAFEDVVVLPVMHFLRENYLTLHCTDETEAFLQMVCRDGLHTSKVGNAVISHLIRGELLKMVPEVRVDAEQPL